MTDPFANGPMAMIKIDGAKIKSLREQQGLTQLYLATAVQVTTDTISRWENKRYPTIKKENGLKLAEALNVPLEELLLLDDVDFDEQVSPQSEGIDQQPIPQAPQPAKKAPRKWPIFVLSATLCVVVAILGWFVLQSTHKVVLKAVRLLPNHCIAGQPVPILIKISGLGDNPKALIIKEQSPPGAKISATFPEASSVNTTTNEIKWLGKVTADSAFAYIVKLKGNIEDKKTFTGYAALNKDSDDIPQIGGNNTVTITPFHWGDTDQNNIISDKEILAVYDRFADFKELAPELDLIEEIWLGSGYKWNSTKGKIEILD